MSRVRARNDLMRLDNSSIREVVDLDMQTIEGEKMNFGSLTGEYVLIYFGELSGFLQMYSNIGKSVYFGDVHFVFVTEGERLKRIVEDAMRDRLPRT